MKNLDDLIEEYATGICSQFPKSGSQQLDEVLLHFVQVQLRMFAKDIRRAVENEALRREGIDINANE